MDSTTANPFVIILGVFAISFFIMLMINTIRADRKNKAKEKAARDAMLDLQFKMDMLEVERRKQQRVDKHERMYAYNPRTDPYPSREEVLNHPNYQRRGEIHTTSDGRNYIYDGREWQQIATMGDIMSVDPEEIGTYMGIEPITDGDIVIEGEEEEEQVDTPTECKSIW